MSPEMGSETSGCGLDAAAYALGALDPDEADRFAIHLDSCAVCRDELAAFQHVASVLPLAVPQIPAPKRLRRRLLSAARTAPQPRSERRRSLRTAASGHRPGWLRPALAFGSAAAIVLAVAGGIELGDGGSASRQYQVQVIGSPGSARLRVAGSHAELIVHHLPPPRPGHIYEVWLQRAHRSPTPTSALFSVTSAGDGDVAVPGGVAGVRRVMVTQEPAGGSSVPTSAPLLVAAL
jgi:anti-sigma-K factor RskA